MIVIGIAGGIASGKSTVADEFEKLGALIIDADAIGHDLLKTDDMKRKLVDAFGDGILTPDEGVDRRALGRIIFNNEEARLKLNNIVRPSIRAEIRRRIAEQRHAGYQGVIVVDAPLLVEAGPTDLADTVILVTAPAEIRKARIIKRNGLTEEEAEQRISAQKTDAQQMRWADHLVENAGTRQDLVRRAKDLWTHIVKS